MYIIYNKTTSTGSPYGNATPWRYNCTANCWEKKSFRSRSWVFQGQRAPEGARGIATEIRNMLRERRNNEPITIPQDFVLLGSEGEIGRVTMFTSACTPLVLYQGDQAAVVHKSPGFKWESVIEATGFDRELPITFVSPENEHIIEDARAAEGIESFRAGGGDPYPANGVFDVGTREDVTERERERLEQTHRAEAARAEAVRQGERIGDPHRVDIGSGAHLGQGSLRGSSSDAHTGAGDREATNVEPRIDTGRHDQIEGGSHGGEMGRIERK